MQEKASTPKEGAARPADFQDSRDEREYQQGLLPQGRLNFGETFARLPGMNL